MPTQLFYEQACAIAAEAYARVNNEIGLVMVTTGPGGNANPTVLSLLQLFYWLY